MTMPDQPDYCWPVDPGCMDAAWDALGNETKDRATALATGSLHALTAGRVGGCPITVRPCSQRRAEGFVRGTSANSWSPLNWNGTWINCGCAGLCGCETGCQILLDGFVGRVDEVKVGGVAVDPTKMKLINNEKIVWQGGGDCPFPKYQDMSKPLGDPGTMSVTYLPAHEPDGAAAWAAGLLAMEFGKACSGKTCRLPKGVTQVVRQGVVITLNSGAFPSGLTGIPEVDAWVSLWNPNKLRRQPAVWSPDMPEAWIES